MAKLVGRNQRTCTCKLCGQKFQKNSGNVYATFRSGNQSTTGSFLCDNCIETLFSYYYKNDKVVGKLDKRGQESSFSYGCEWESSYSDGDARIELALNGIVPTSDCTVDVEYKTPIMLGLQSLAKWVITVDRLIENGNLSFADTSEYKVGSHFHVGHTEYINDTTINYVRRFYNSLFVALSDEMKLYPNEVRELFGRNFNETEWARPIDMNSYAESHTNFINVQHSKTLEFRLCKYQNGQQYLRVAHFCKDITAIVVEEFIKKFDESLTVENKKALALNASAKMVETFHKYINR